jgi:SAM-dependent methyltransferase
VEAGAWEAGAAAWVALVRDNARGAAHDASIRDLLPPSGGAALDIGCGEGRWVRYLAATGWHARGVDRSEALVAEARAAHPDGEYVVAEATALPADDASVDLVLCVNDHMACVHRRCAKERQVLAGRRRNRSQCDRTHPHGEESSRHAPDRSAVRRRPRRLSYVGWAGSPGRRSARG